LLDKIFNYEFDWYEQFVKIDYYCNGEEFVIFDKSFNAIIFTNIDTVIVDYYETKHFKIFCQNEDYNTVRVIVNTLYKAMSEAEQFFEMNIREENINVHVYNNEKELQQEFFSYNGLNDDTVVGFARVLYNKDAEIFVISPSGYNDYDIVIKHEFIHTVVLKINRNCNRWIDEGTAIYLSEKNSIFPWIVNMRFQILVRLKLTVDQNS
jgi:hypothetical protein